MVKQVIVIRKDLKTRRGKEISQGSHASIAFLTSRIREKLDRESFGTLSSGELEVSVSLSKAEVEWIDGPFTKVCVKVDSEEELMKIKDNAEKAGLNYNLIVDSGKTEFGGKPTLTCMAIGPDEEELIDKVTGHLKLY